jgi:hypothetical protein
LRMWLKTKREMVEEVLVGKARTRR